MKTQKNIIKQKDKGILVPEEIIERKIFLIREQKVILDFHLAELYGVKTKLLKRAVRRNINRFPPDFMFVLNTDEYNSLRRQIGSLKRGTHAKYLPYAFTEQGIAMLSSVLNSERAIQMNIAIMRAFVKLREIITSNKELAQKLIELERKIEVHDDEIQEIYEVIRRLLEPPQQPRRQIGFRIEEPKTKYKVKRR